MRTHSMILGLGDIWYVSLAGNHLARIVWGAESGNDRLFVVGTRR